MKYSSCMSSSGKRLLVGLLAAICAISLLSNCSSTSAQRAQWTRDAAGPLSCSKGADCEEKWERALNWVRENADAPIQHADDTIITTAIPSYSPSAVVSVTKNKETSETYSINFRAGCSSIFGCEPSILELKASFANYVMRSIGFSSTGSLGKSKIDKDITRRKAQLGAVTVKVDQNTANRLQMKGPQGTRITHIGSGPAFDSGLRTDDVILKFGQQTISDDQELDAALERTAVPAKILITIWRAGEGEIVMPVQF